jgi:hypothetical protein
MTSARIETIAVVRRSSGRGPGPCALLCSESSVLPGLSGSPCPATTRMLSGSFSRLGYYRRRRPKRSRAQSGGRLGRRPIRLYMRGRVTAATLAAQLVSEQLRNFKLPVKPEHDCGAPRPRRRRAGAASSDSDECTAASCAHGRHVSLCFQFRRRLTQGSPAGTRG